MGGFLGLPSVNGDFGGETSGSSGFSPAQIADLTNFSIDDNGTAPTPSDPGSGGSFLNELGALSGIITGGASNIIRSTKTPQPVIIPRTTNLPASSLQRLTGTGGSSILVWVLLGLAIVIGLKFLRK